MEKTQLIKLDPPNELVFTGPFNEVVTSYLKLHNVVDYPVCFKVKTTAPKMYCVRPNSGTIEPQSTVDVAIMLQPFDFESLDKTKHKFMVQSIKAPTPPIDMEKMWKECDQNEVVNTKLKCVFENSHLDRSEAQSLAHKTANFSPDNNISHGNNLDMFDETSALRLRNIVGPSTKLNATSTPHGPSSAVEQSSKGGKETADNRFDNLVPQKSNNGGDQRYRDHAQIWNIPAITADLRNTTTGTYSTTSSRPQTASLTQLFMNMPVLIALLISFFVGIIIAKMFF